MAVQVYFDSNDIKPLVAAVVAQLTEQLIPDDRLSVDEREASRLLGIEWHTLRDARRRHEISASKVGKSWLYQRTDLLRFLETRKGEEASDSRPHDDADSHRVPLRRRGA